MHAFLASLGLTHRQLDLKRLGESFDNGM